MARWGPALAAGLACAIVAPAAVAGQETGEEPVRARECTDCLNLLVPVGARAGALGGTTGAMGGSDAVFGNPAGLVTLSRGYLVLHHSDDTTVDVQVNAFSALFTPWAITVGLSYQLFDRGEIVSTDIEGEETGKLLLRDHLGVASLAFPLFAGFSAGINFKVFQQRTDCQGLCGGQEYVSTTQAMDMGLRWSPRWHPALEVGLMVVNSGPTLQVPQVEGGELLPARFTIGMAYDVLALAPTEELVGLRIAVDLRDKLSGAWTPMYSVGLELDVQEAVFLRAGYAPGEGLGTGAAVGLELRYDRFNLGVSRAFANSALEADEEPFQVSLGVNF